MTHIDLKGTSIEYRLHMRDALRAQIQEIEKRMPQIGNSPEAHIDYLSLQGLFNELSSELVDEMQQLHHPDALTHPTPAHGILANDR